jgi:hypothetical protein
MELMRVLVVEDNSVVADAVAEGCVTRAWR